MEKAIPAISVYPNPVDVGTRIAFTVSKRAPVDISLYSTQGKQVSTLFHSDTFPGRHILPWDGRDGDGRHLPIGLYYILIRSAEGARSVKVMVGE